MQESRDIILALTILDGKSTKHNGVGYVGCPSSNGNGRHHFARVSNQFATLYALESSRRGEKSSPFLTFNLLHFGNLMTPRRSFLSVGIRFLGTPPFIKFPYDFRVHQERKSTDSGIHTALLQTPSDKESNKGCCSGSTIKPSKNVSPDKDIQDSKILMLQVHQEKIKDLLRNTYCFYSNLAQATSTNKLSTNRKSVSTDRPSVSTDRPFVSTDRPFVSTDRSTVSTANKPYVSAARNSTGANAGES
ncbi:hypothetical protein Tco_0924537 [Tanacetum coccineum]|uniref:Uncharacterized protein n=1 Tax=Tanacetum coccineum TaxID=301880 RepID=A0ABQ5D524_9ASTR